MRSTLLPSLAVASIAAASGMIAACAGAAPDLVVAPTPTASASAAPGLPAKAVSLKDAGVNPQNLDRTADACVDFYQLACGGLIKNVEIPADKSAWGPAYELQEQTEGLLRETLEKAAKGGDDPATKKLGAFHAACMDEAAIEKQGTKPLKSLLDAVGKVKDVKSLYAAVTALHKQHIFAFFDITSQQDFKDATLVIAGLDQNGLGLPDRDYYLQDDAKAKETRDFYVGHIERILTLAGDKPAAAKKAAAEILRLETAIAKLAQDKVTRRDPYKIYNRVDRKGLTDAAKRFPWDDYFKALGFPEIKDVTVNSVAYFSGIDGLIASEKPEAWRQYLRWVVLSTQASRLGKAFVEERFSLRSKLTGQKAIEPRWKRCVHAADDALGELLAQAYVKAKFDAESKRAAEDLIKSIRAAMKAELSSLPWMDPATRTAAEEKLNRMNDKIGYPAKWKSYDFEIGKDYASNMLAADAFELARNLKKVGKPVDRQEWQMTPPTVNAYYDPSLNEMVFPAGILQPPFFAKSFAAAVNFGATGGVMGHELTHGFDDEGSQFDGAGNLRNWWSEATAKQFEEQTKCVVDQYSGYDAVPGVKLNGKLTAGENIADIGGVKLAWTAFRESRKGATETINAEGFTEDQLFFLGFAQSWCQKERPELLELMARTNPHSPPRWRVDGVLSDVSAFAEAFSCKEGTPMRPAKVCTVW
ncbi:MAG: M13 family metallopeptidase [Minicystis sp.]